MLSKTLSSGIKCFIVPKKDFVEKQAMVVVRFGSDISAFTVNNRHYTIPEGTAHFIEHKMFDMEDGNITQAFTDFGAVSNAFTTFDETAYYFTCTENFYKNLELLIKMVSTPVFVKDSIDRERKIIAREINMYQDDVGWQCYFNLLGCMYAENPVRNGISGTEDEIEKINADIMHLCYDTFYTPKNIALVVAGDVDCEKVIDIAEKNFSLPQDKQVKVENLAHTPIVEAYTNKYMKINMPMFYIGFKGGISPITAKDIVTNRLMLDYIAGDCSALYQHLLNLELVDEPMGFEYLKGRDYTALLLSGNSKSPSKVLEMTIREIDRIKSQGFNNFDDILKKQRNKFILQQDNLNSICTAIADCFAKGIDYLDICNLYDKIIIDNYSFDAFDNIALSVVSGSE